MPSSIEEVQEQILALLTAQIANRNVSVYEQGVPDGDNVRRVTGSGAIATMPRAKRLKSSSPGG